MKFGELFSLAGNPRREFTGRWGILGKTLGVVGASLSIYLIATGTVTYYKWFAIFLLFTNMCLIKWMPFRSGKSGKLGFIVDGIIICAGASACVFAIADYERLIYRSVDPITLDIVFGSLLIISLLELSRRTNGTVLSLLAFLFLAYGFVGFLLPGILWHRGYSPERLIGFQYLTEEGIFGVPTRVCATIIVVLVLFGAFLRWTRGMDFINDVAFGIAGRTIGGPAKVAAVASAGFGMVSGSAVANVATTGQFTIPLMKKLGFEPHIAGAVEAAASSGGQIMPPIMGASVFIMAALIGIPYPQIMIAGIIIALLYFFAIYWSVHFYSIAKNIQPLPKEIPLPSVKVALKWGWVFLIPLALLFYLIIIYYPLGKAVIITIITMVILTAILPRTRLNLRSLLNALDDGFTEMVPITAACACAGMIIGVIALTGIGTKLSNAIIELGGGNFFAILILTAIVTIILGMGLPTTACYLVAVSVVGPVLIGLGLTPLSSHMFVFVFAVFSGLTPPVALAAYTGAGIAKADPLKTAITSMVIGCVAYIVPFLFAYDECFLTFFLGGFSLNGLIIIVTAFFGFFVIPMGVMGAIKKKASLLERLLIILGGVLMISLHHWQSLIGLIIVASTIFVHVTRYRNAKKSSSI